MKNIITFLSLFLLGTSVFPCAYYDSEYEYYNLFVQKTINSPIYEPFLLVYDSPYYESEAYNNLPNENIEEWQKYFSISYEDARYLVFEAERKEVDALAKGGNSSDAKLKFIDNSFKAKYKQALLYLSYAKYLEPYMEYRYDGFWEDRVEQAIEKLDYSKVINVLTRSWNAETENELKLRYGYQLVRFAHYNHKFKDAVKYFNQYVESLNYKPIMYYYALDQKGGAERALGNYMQANYDFFRFFSQTKNRKTNAYTSMKVTQDLDFQKMLAQVKTEQEKNDLYLLLGYKAFNNPLVELNKILVNSPNAIQAKVLMARAVNQLERSVLPVSYSCGYGVDCEMEYSDHRLPVLEVKEVLPFLNEALETSKRQMKVAEDKGFWQLTTSYLHFLKKDYNQSKQILAQINSKDTLIKEQKERMGMLLEIVEKERIDAAFEQMMLTKYNSIFYAAEPVDYYSYNTTSDFIVDVLANRYLLQGDLAKSFLLQNNVADLEYNPNVELLNQIESFYYKKNKNKFEKYLFDKINDSFYVADDLKSKVVYDFPNWLANMRGTLALADGDFKNAEREFSKVDKRFSLRGGYVGRNEYGYSTYAYDVYNGFSNISNNIFGYNKMVCFNCPEDKVMSSVYLDEFPFIKSKMNKLELTEALVQLSQFGNKKDEKAAKANYLLANFYYNTTNLGYFRELLRFDVNNLYGPKFHEESYYSPDLHAFYFKHYGNSANYSDNFKRPFAYAEKAYQLAKTDDLKARIAFTATSCEQGIFYDSMETDPDILKLDLGWKHFNSEELRDVKVRKYRKYFKELSKYSETAAYDEYISSCNYFNYYSENY